MSNADDPRSGTPMNTDEELRQRAITALKSSVMSFTDYGAKQIWEALAPIIVTDRRKSNLQRAIEELENFNLPQYDHSKCPDPKTCIGYENAQSDFDNEKELRINELQAELQQVEKGENHV